MFLSHLCGGTLPVETMLQMPFFLSHLCGGTRINCAKYGGRYFLSHLCGGTQEHFTSKPRVNQYLHPIKARNPLFFTIT